MKKPTKTSKVSVKNPKKELVVPRKTSGENRVVFKKKIQTATGWRRSMVQKRAPKKAVKA